MYKILWEIFVVFALTLLNGFFSCSEIALISVRKSRIAELVKRGSSRASIINSLQNTPEKLFATIQIGISVLTIAASAFAGSSLAEQLGDWLTKFNSGLIGEYAHQISFVLVVGVVSFVSLIMGELVPKSLGLRYSEQFAFFAAYPIWWFSKITFWLDRPLSFTSNLILKPFKDSTRFTESILSQEEIRSLLEEGEKAGTIPRKEHDIIENVFDSFELTASKIMVPRSRMTAVNINDQSADMIKRAIDSGFSRVPVFEKSINHIVGILYTKKLLSTLVETKNLGVADVREFLVPAYFVPGTMKIGNILQRLQRKKLHMAMVTNEHGEVEGLVTLEDVLEEIVGDIKDETDEAGKSVLKQSDGSFLVTGEISIIDFNRQMESHLPEDNGYSTLSGFLVDKLGRFPDEGDTVAYENLSFLIKTTTLRVVKSVEVKALNAKTLS